MLCPNCETENRDSAKFCDECGFPLVSTEAEPSGGETAKIGDAEGLAYAAGDASSDEAEIGGGAGGNAESAGAAEGVADGPDGAEGSGPSEQPTEFISAAEGEARREGEVEDLDTYNRDATEVIRPDLLGFDTLADDFGAGGESGSENPASGWGSGHTMQMQKVEGEGGQKGKDFRASSTVGRKSRGKVAAIAAAAAAAVLAIVAFGTYQAGIWGGKVVPDVTGMTEADARSVLVGEGFETRIEQVKSDDTEGLVLIMDPAAGSRLDEGDEVVIHVATSRIVPDVTGMAEKDAIEALGDEGFVNVDTKKKSSEKMKGTVIGVEPKAGERAISSTAITLTIAEPYTVPDVSGKSLDDAAKAIEKAGLGYEAVYISTDSYAEGTVIATEPAAGAEVKKGSYVVVQVAQARGAELEQIVREQLAAGMTIDKNGRSYIVDSLDSVAFLGNDTVSYTATAREYVYVFGNTVTNPSAESISGTVVFNENNEIVAIS